MAGREFQEATLGALVADKLSKYDSVEWNVFEQARQLDADLLTDDALLATLSDKHVSSIVDMNARKSVINDNANRAEADRVGVIVREVLQHSLIERITATDRSPENQMSLLAKLELFRPEDSEQTATITNVLFKAYMSSQDATSSSKLAKAFEAIAANKTERDGEAVCAVKNGSETMPAQLYKLTMMAGAYTQNPDKVDALADVFGYRTQPLPSRRHQAQEAAVQFIPKVVAIGVIGATGAGMLAPGVAQAETKSVEPQITVVAASSDTFTPRIREEQTTKANDLPQTVPDSIKPPTTTVAVGVPAEQIPTLAPNVTSTPIPSDAVPKTPTTGPAVAPSPSTTVTPEAITPPQSDVAKAQFDLATQYVEIIGKALRSNSTSMLQGGDFKPDAGDRMSKNLIHVAELFQSELQKAKAGDTKVVADASKAWQEHFLTNANLDYYNPDQLSVILAVEADAQAMESIGDKAGANHLRSVAAYTVEVSMLMNDKNIKVDFTDVTPPQPHPKASPETPKSHHTFKISAAQQAILNEIQDPKTRAFLERFYPGVMQAALEGAKFNTQVLIAQGFEENGLHGNVLSNTYNNFFGMKAGSDWKGKIVRLPTWEVYNGQRVQIYANFEWFDTPADCIKEYARLINTKAWYKDAIANYRDVDHYLQGILSEPGHPQGTPGSMSYATDPAYASKIKRLISTYHLDELTAGAYNTHPKTASKPAPSHHGHETRVTGEAAIRKHVVAIARSQNGVHETPQHCDRGNTSAQGSCGPGVDKYTQMHKEYWCNDFTSWVEEAGSVPITGNRDAWRLAAVNESIQRFKDLGGYHARGKYTPQPGDQIFFDPSHTGMVLYTHNGRVYVEEGNASDKYSRNGHAVAEHSYALDDPYIVGIGDLSVLITANQ